MLQNHYHLLSDLYTAFKDKDVRLLKKVNDKSAVLIAVEFDQVIYDVSILSYILAKLTSKPRFWTNPDSKTRLAQVRLLLKEAADSAKREETSAVQSAISEAFEQVKMIESSDRRFISDFEQKARLKLASTLYAQGFSLGNASSVTGVEKREILSYAGKTMMFDRLKSEVRMDERLKRIRKIFKD